MNLLNKIILLSKAQYKRYFDDFLYKLGLYRKANKCINNDYEHLTSLELLKYKKSEKIFILGSGFSINDLTEDEIKHIEKFDTFAFNGFLEHFHKLRIDFFLAREFLGFNNDITSQDMKENGMYDFYFSDKSNKVKYAQDTVFLLQHELAAYSVNSILAQKMIKKGRKIFTFKNHFLRKFYYPTKSLKKLVHYSGSISDVVHASYALGYKEIVLVGVDLYDRNHFWLPKDETSLIDKDRGYKAQDIHNTATPTIKMFDKWNKFFKEEGVVLSVYNPRSLLKDIMPIYEKGE